MKKVFVALSAALAMTAGVAIADDQAGGAAASGIGGVKTEHIVAGAVGIAVAAAIISNSRGTTIPGPGPIDPIDPVDPVCEEGEELVNGECVPVEPPVTVTVTSTGTATVTVTGN